ncbi:pentapeptide repeat-containing protein [Rhodosalinus sp.]|uniref:pentapeptide repeat-containing protein n=1 Tax=Rhodosalinus sp. TaxID=2047741 RepID=UPI003977F8C9
MTTLTAPEGARLRRLQRALGLPAANPLVMAAVGLLWLALALLLAGGLFTLIWVTLTQGVIAPDAGADLWEFRFRLAQMLALTTVLGAVVALPITLTRLRLSREQAETAKEALFNQKVTEAAADLYAQRQVTLRPITGGPVNGWEDDIVRRNAAIDRLEGLVRERPGEAERVARLLSTYVRELSREHPPKPVPETEDVDSIKAWAGGLRPARSDMQNAAQVLGRLARVNDSDAVRHAIDLRGANLQGFDLQACFFPRALFAEAQMQGAMFMRADLQGALIMRADVRGASFFDANLRNAVFSVADLRGAVLAKAQLRGAWLIGAQLQGAELADAQLQGADLRETAMDSTTDLTSAALKGAAIGFIDDVTTTRLQPHWHEIFADGSVSLPGGERPAHWPSEVLDWHDFRDAWRAWQQSIGMDPDDPK